MTNGHQIEENDPVGWVVLHAKEIAEGIPAAFAGAAAVVEQQDTDDFAEAERHNRQIVAAQTQYREAEQETS